MQALLLCYAEISSMLENPVDGKRCQAAHQREPCLESACMLLQRLGPRHEQDPSPCPPQDARQGHEKHHQGQNPAGCKYLDVYTVRGYLVDQVPRMTSREKHAVCMIIISCADACNGREPYQLEGRLPDIGPVFEMRYFSQAVVEGGDENGQNEKDQADAE